MKRALDKLKNQDGVSMIIAIVFYLVITLACITLFHVTSGAIRQSANYRDGELAKILAVSMSEVVQEQIQSGIKEKIDAPYDETGGKDGSYLIEPTNELSGYIHKNLNHSWLYYNDSQLLWSNKDAATRVLVLDGLDKLEGYDASGQISMYWTSDMESEIENEYRNRMLYVTVTITVGTETASIISEFEMLGHAYKYGGSSETLDDQYFWWKYNGEMK